MKEDVENFKDRIRKENQEKRFFIEQKHGAEINWFFTQAAQALDSELYLPACSSFLIGIEASLRVTLAQVENTARIQKFYSDKTLSNRLLKSAQDAGLPVKALAFPGENNFQERLESIKPNKINAEIVRVRHDICHGNILEYINVELGEKNAFFTPECCRELANQLHQLSKEWASQLREFKRNLFSA